MDNRESPSGLHSPYRRRSPPLNSSSGLTFRQSSPSPKMSNISSGQTTSGPNGSNVFNGLVGVGPSSSPGTGAGGGIGSSSSLASRGVKPRLNQNPQTHSYPNYNSPTSSPPTDPHGSIGPSGMHGFNGMNGMNGMIGTNGKGRDMMDEPGLMAPESTVYQSISGGEYAYSTTLRRHTSTEPYPPFHTTGGGSHRNQTMSPHVASPFRKRTNSGSHGHGGSLRRPWVIEEEEERDGVVGRVVRGVKRVLGRDEGYEALKQVKDEERRLSDERRERETPSAIYAHKSIDVSPPFPFPYPISSTNQPHIQHQMYAPR